MPSKCRVILNEVLNNTLTLVFYYGTPPFHFYVGFNFLVREGETKNAFAYSILNLRFLARI